MPDVQTHTHAHTTHEYINWKYAVMSQTEREIKANKSDSKLTKNRRYRNDEEEREKTQKLRLKMSIGLWEQPCQ